MIKRISTIALPQLIVVLFILGTMTVRDYTKFLLGNEETNFLSFVFVLYGFILILFQFIKHDSKHELGIFTLFLTLVISTLGYSSLPERQLKRANFHYQQFENTDLSSVKNDNLHSIRIDYLKREQKARQLELEVAELRYSGPKEFYGFGKLGYILFFSSICTMFALGIWIFFKFDKYEIISKIDS
jgi:hypothetical protein